jgi:competence protein ComK
MIKENYDVNAFTCAIISRGEKNCEIINFDKNIMVENSALDVIEYLCNYFGSSFSGRIEGSRFLLGSFYKLPIIIEEGSESIFFPTTSYKNRKCSWVSLNMIKDYHRENLETRVIFDNGYEIFLPVSFDSFETQVLRASKLLLTLKRRKQKNEE